MHPRTAAQRVAQRARRAADRITGADAQRQRDAEQPSPRSVLDGYPGRVARGYRTPDQLTDADRRAHDAGQPRALDYADEYPDAGRRVHAFRGVEPDERAAAEYADRYRFDGNRRIAHLAFVAGATWRAARHG